MGGPVRFVECRIRLLFTVRLAESSPESGFHPVAPSGRLLVGLPFHPAVWFQLEESLFQGLFPVAPFRPEVLFHPAVSLRRLPVEEECSLEPRHPEPELRS